MKLTLTAENARELKVVRTHDPKKAIRGTFPDFLIVGPQRTGTTWLAANFRYHPQIRLSYPKELYYFSRLKRATSSKSYHTVKLDRMSFRDSPRRWGRQVVKAWYTGIYKPKGFPADTLECYMEFFKEDRVTRMIQRWEGEYVVQTPMEPTVYGEATASYATLDQDVIGDITRLNPAIKVILMVRHPVDRAWSHVQKDLMGTVGRSFDDLKHEDILRFIDKPSQWANGSYTKAIDTWEKYLAPGSLFIGFYDDISSRPAELLQEIFRFLNVSDERRYVSAKASSRINSFSAVEIPQVYREQLTSMFADEIAALTARFGRPF